VRYRDDDAQRALRAVLQRHDADVEVLGYVGG
jgi:hypothetical protein